MYRTLLLQQKIRKKKNVGEQNLRSSSHFWEIFFRERNFSLKYWAIRPSAVFRTRRETALRGEGFTWVPDLRSLDKLREVGVSPYLGFSLRLSTMLMFRLVEALNGRLIGSKPWNRNAWNVRPTNSPYQFYGLFGLNV